MARIPFVDPESADADPAAVEALRRVSGGAVHPNVYRAMANHPEALRAFSVLGQAVYFENSLTAAQRELAYLTASVTNDCHY